MSAVIPSNASLRWPKKCVICDKHTDSTGTIEGARAVGGSFWIIFASIKYKKLKMTYPICRKHHIQKLIARFIYFLSVACFVILGISLLMNYLYESKIDTLQLMIFISSIVVFIFSMKFIPIKLKILKDDSAMIIFKNDRYAYEFEMANNDKILR